MDLTGALALARRPGDAKARWGGHPTAGRGGSSRHGCDGGQAGPVRELQRLGTGRGSTGRDAGNIMTPCSGLPDRAGRPTDRTPSEHVEAVVETPPYDFSVHVSIDREIGNHPGRGPRRWPVRRRSGDPRSVSATGHVGRYRIAVVITAVITTLGAMAAVGFVPPVQVRSPNHLQLHDLRPRRPPQRGAASCTSGSSGRLAALRAIAAALRR